MKGEYYYINEISYYILQFCKQKHTLQEIIDYIVNTYDVDVNLVTEDMKNIVQEFVNCGIASSFSKSYCYGGESK